jgi:undecaprenyl-diphosphatase
MTPLQGAILGLVQGITEFLPISSSGHLVLVPWFLNWEEPGLPFDTMVHLGTLLGVVAYFRKDLVEIIRAFLSDLRSGGRPTSVQSKLAWLIILGTLPAALMGLLFEDFFESLFSAPFWVACLLLVTGIILALSEAIGTTRRNLEEISWLDSLVIGIAQGCAIAPGISRSGATVATGLFSGLHREAAARYSFLLSIPIILGTSVLQLRDLVQSPEAVAQVPTIAIGFVVAALSGYFSIKFLLHYLRRGRLYPFAIYCWTVGIISIVAILIRG